MRIFKEIPILEFLFFIIFHCYSCIMNLFYFGFFVLCEPGRNIKEFPLLYFELYLTPITNIYISLPIFIIICFIFTDISNKKLILRYFIKNFCNNKFLMINNLILLIFSTYYQSHIVFFTTPRFLGLPFFMYLLSSAGHFTIFILLWRLLDKFKDKPFAIKLRNLKKKFYAKISKKLFKAYVKNKLIRNEIEKDLTTQKTSLKNS